MVNLTSLSNQTRTDLLRYLGSETGATSSDEYNDKLRVLIIIVLCTQDRSLVTEAIATVKRVNGNKLTP